LIKKRLLWVAAAVVVVRERDYSEWIKKKKINNEERES
jgi:hypothetical protein